MVTFLCLLSSIVSAKEPEEVLVVARRIEIVLNALEENHRQHPITGNWYYVGELLRKDDEKLEDKRFEIVMKKTTEA